MTLRFFLHLFVSYVMFFHHRSVENRCFHNKSTRQKNSELFIGQIKMTFKLYNIQAMENVKNSEKYYPGEINASGPE